MPVDTFNTWTNEEKTRLEKLFQPINRLTTRDDFDGHKKHSVMVRKYFE
jgi:hypothetical protein